MGWGGVKKNIFVLDWGGNGLDFCPLAGLKEGDFNKLRHVYISFIVRFQILWPRYLYQNIWHFKFAPSQEFYINVLEILIKGTITKVFWIFQT